MIFLTQMKSSILFYFLLLAGLGHAQVLPGLNSVWKVQERRTYNGMNPEDTITDYSNYHLKDSIFRHGKWYNILYDNLDTVALIRSEGKKILARTAPELEWSSGTYDTSEFVLYDFGMNINDTIALKFHGLYFWTGILENWESFRLVAKDSVLTSSGLRLRLKLVYELNSSTPNSSPISGYAGQRCYGDTLIWIEGIGTQQGFYYPIDGSDCEGFAGDSFLHRLICVETDTVNIYQPYGTCSPGFSLEEQRRISEAVVYPNPAKDEISVKLPNTVAGQMSISIFNLMGKRVFEGIHNGSDEVLFLNISDLQDGIYTIRLQNEKGTDYNLRFVKSTN